MTPSVLASLIDFCNGWTLSGSTAIFYEHRAAGALFTHSLRLDSQETRGSLGFDQAKLLERFVCQILVSALPDQALPETKENLIELYGHYAVPRGNVELIEVAPGQSFEAVVGTSHPRPDIELEG
jgi:hypothetical protein